MAGKFATNTHKLLAGCIGRALKDAAADNPVEAARLFCHSKLDPTDPVSALSRSRRSAERRIAKGCASTVPDELHKPCSDAAVTLDEVAQCVLDHHVVKVSEMVAAEYENACSILGAVGLSTVFPAACR
jgi:hypothetical protein